MIKSWKIPKTFKVVELVLFHPFVGDWSLITLFNIDFMLMLKGDHAPGFRLGLVGLNINILEFSVYDIRHSEER